MSEAPVPSSAAASPDVVELRVHRVSGAGATHVLKRPHVQQVAGDRHAGLHQPRPGYPDSTDAGGVGQPTGLRLAVSALVPVAAVGLVWWLATRPGLSFEAFHAPAGVISTLRLAVVERRDDAPVVGRLRSIHVAAAFATLNGILRITRAGTHASPVTVLLGLATAGVLLAGLALVLARGRDYRGDHAVPPIGE